MTLGKTAVRVVNLGRISYGQALQVQQKHVRQHLDKTSDVPNTLLLCEHHPVYTIGIRQAPYPPEEEERLKGLGAEFFRTNRGGLITFHGPGIHCGRYITSHGIALNCNTEMNWFDNIVPCGIVGKGVTSLSLELSRDVTAAEATPYLLESFSKRFNCHVLPEREVL
ncbi:putative lipoyltransferase 2, mitochondrial isoform X2 [Alosa alosa]|uniref:putative lipoyltransferase 2, mitochondrial isoform X2 n=1 Tax=Alosa alosa TaxID=278164 RepID=UPI0020150A1E|nr:putative lipoyltransferase 2, mitochondrial isoform X2 [Alosa alosa]